MRFVKFAGGYLLCLAGAYFLLNAQDLLEAIGSLTGIIFGFIVCLRATIEDSHGR